MDTDGVFRLASTSTGSGDGAVVEADLRLDAADSVVATLETLGVPSDDFVISQLEVVAPAPEAKARLGAGEAFAWVEVLGEARRQARPLARYFVLMAVAGVVAGLGVIKGNAILIVGAMAVSPDLLPISAACVGIVARRLPLASRAVGTLLLGIALTWAVSAALAWGLQAVDILSSSFQVREEGLHGLDQIDYSTVLVALAAGVAAMLSFETRAAAAVGVGISVTTIPASALFGVSLGLGEVSASWGAAAVLGLNVTLLLFSGVVTLLVQRRLAASRRGPAPGVTG